MKKSGFEPQSTFAVLKVNVYFSKINDLLPSESPFSNIDFPPLLLITTTYIQGIFFSEKSDHTREKTREKKNCPKNIVRPGAIKFGAIVPSRVSPFMPLVNQASPILAPIKGFFGPKDHQVKRSCSFFFLEKKIQSL